MLNRHGANSIYLYLITNTPKWLRNNEIIVFKKRTIREKMTLIPIIYHSIKQYKEQISAKNNKTDQTVH